MIVVTSHDTFSWCHTGFAIFKYGHLDGSVIIIKNKRERFFFFKTSHGQYCMT